VLYGSGRLTFENSAKAIYADLFPDERAMAFASLNFVSGSFSSIFAYLLAGGVDNGKKFNGFLILCLCMGFLSLFAFTYVLTCI